LDKAVDEAAGQLGRMSNERSPKYEKSLIRLVSEAADAIQMNNLEVLSNRRDQTVLRNELPELKKKLQKRKGKLFDIQLAEEALDSVGGVVVRDKDKKRIFNNTIEARLANAKKQLGNSIFGDLFEGNTGETGRN
jgi:V/A-type H+-transporting ATPase subunit E